MPIVYRLSFPDGSFYIGATVKTLKGRMGPHWQAVARGSQSPLYEKFREFGEPLSEILSSWCTKEEAWEAERKAIVEHSPDLNVQSGGRPSESLRGNDYKKGKKETLETRTKKAIAQKGNQNRKGTPHSEEVKRRISQTLRNKREVKNGSPL